ncbi:MAG: hypothetical protein ACK4R6_14395 [Spirosomataceae bacterium]
MKKLLLLACFALVSLISNAQNVNLKKYIGIFQLENAPVSKIEISLENGKLIGSGDGNTSSLDATDKPDVFSVSAYNGSATFLKNANGIITGMELTLNGETFIGKRPEPQPTDYQGNYEMSGAPFDVLTVSVQGGVLQATAPGVGQGPLDWTVVYDEFYESNNGATLVFKRDANGSVQGVTILVQGMELIGKKVN